ncbi:MAG: helix-turn-helix transcriptional regulator [Polyangiaceae bacterium]
MTQQADNEDSPNTTPLDLRVSTLELEGEELMVVSFVPQLDLPETSALTDAEREVATLVVAGFSNADIGRLRSTTIRTVSKQLEAIYRKLSVSSRSELAATLRR